MLSVSSAFGSEGNSAMDTKSSSNYQRKFDSLISNSTLTSVDKSCELRKDLTGRVVWKFNENNEGIRATSRTAIRGFIQDPGVDSITSMLPPQLLRQSHCW